MVARTLLAVLVAGGLALPLVGRHGGRADAAESPADRASVICFSHGGVRSFSRRVIVCFDGAPHGWDGREVRLRH